MEPLIVINGDSGVHISKPCRLFSFNGAVDRDQRRLQLPAILGDVEGASMEPLIVINGDLAVFVPATMSFEVLQWSR